MSRDAGLAAARTTELSQLLLLEAAEAAAAGHTGDALSRAQRRQTAMASLYVVVSGALSSKMATRIARSGERSALLNTSLVGGLTPNTTTTTTTNTTSTTNTTNTTYTTSTTNATNATNAALLDATGRAGGLSAVELRQVCLAAAALTDAPAELLPAAVAAGADLIDDVIAASRAAPHALAQPDGAGAASALAQTLGSLQLAAAARLADARWANAGGDVPSGGTPRLLALSSAFGQTVEETEAVQSQLLAAAHALAAAAVGAGPGAPMDKDTPGDVSLGEDSALSLQVQHVWCSDGQRGSISPYLHASSSQLCEAEQRANGVNPASPAAVAAAEGTLEEPSDALEAGSGNGSPLTADVTAPSGSGEVAPSTAAAVQATTLLLQARRTIIPY